MYTENNELRQQNLTCPQCGVELTEAELKDNACADCIAAIGTHTALIHD
jgi:protein-arginine kinase activator protein McsA